MVTIEAVARKRDVLILLTVTGVGRVAARKEIVKKFKDSAIMGEISEGPWEVVDGVKKSIVFENESFGACITMADIDRAIAANGHEITCGG